ncbi:hypothetical protein CLV62_13910 [Dysgonomonas alginatilytica]|uniref:DUF4906 domain-containing protein n=1 Tax=Dysgonomonas alginatilytica TaxID=1605892 RepID=A0A2V3PKC3_9BACT|nr:DUF4906 domain-containing protein [Dysgonomonas alginatilytica]PXV59273.1 hypothetical protein CLV62_13910 [Dysgonomonas alginatilytica]
MKYNYKNLASILLLSVLFSLVSCSNTESFTSEEATDKDALLNLSIKAGPVNDPLVKGGDGGFSSLALYIFNKTTGYCEYSELITAFTPATLQELSRSVNVSSQTKVIYAIANYNDVNKTFSNTITKTLTMAQLEALTVTNPNGFNDASILMIGKTEVAINSQYVTVEVPMERLVARLDIYMFKSADSQSNTVEVTSIELDNQVLNSRCSYHNTVMITPVTKTNLLRTITANNTLAVTPSDLSAVIPVNAHTSFYTYQNIAASTTTPNDNITPYLKVVVKTNGISHTYKGYITDNGQTTNKYSLMRNNVYRVIGVIGKLNNLITITTTIYPWSVTSSQIGHGVKDTDYILTPFNGNNTGATTGIVQYPYMLNGTGINGTSYANYSFKLTAPTGAIWTATLTNGLEFGFNSTGSTAGKLAVSTGIARTNEYEIKVGALKTWGGTNRTTYMYITVDGIKLKINPVITAPSTRRFPGTTDTDILITQTKYQ